MSFDRKPLPLSFGVCVEQGMVIYHNGLSESRFTPDSATWLGEQLISYAAAAAAQSIPWRK